MTEPLDVSLRQVQDGDLDAFFAHQQDPAARYLAAFVSDNPADREAFDQHWQRIREDSRTLTITVVVGGEIAGHLGAFDRQGDREVTYWVDQRFWGQGVTTLALRQFLSLETHRPLYARVVADNVASQRVLTKCGFVTYGQERDFATGRGQEVIEILFRLDA